MTKILYIYGYLGSPEGDSVQLLRKHLPDCQVFSREYPQLDFKASVTFLNSLLSEYDIDIVIASSLGAFIALNLPDAKKIIAVNPCMEPCRELPKIKVDPSKMGAAGKMIDAYRDAQSRIWNHKPSKYIKGCFSFPGQDELLGDKYLHPFREHYGETTFINCPHKMNADIMPALKEIISELNSIR